MATPKMEWVNEVPPSTRTSKWREVAEALAESPGKWAKLPQATPLGAAAGAQRLRKLGCEAIARGVVLYARATKGKK